MQQDAAEALDLIPDHVNRLTVGEWAEARRVLPASLTSQPGPFRWSVAPYMREIADCFSESSDVERVAFMKGSQITATTGVLENFLGYIIDAAPGPTMFISADKGTAETSVELRIDQMLESTGLESKVFAQTEKRSNKKTGDTKSKKEFPGGFLLAVGPNTGAKLRSFPIRYLLCDEVDGYPQEVGTSDMSGPRSNRSVNKKAAEGDPIALAEKRTDTFEAIRKILYISTPLIEATSRIKRFFDAGDCRYYYVPCRHCGHMQRLRWRDEDGRFRLKFNRNERGELDWDSVHYECEKCGGAWTNDDKAWFLPRGEWRFTKPASKPRFRSYHLNALYSPVGMHSWEAVCQEWIDIGEPQDLMRLKTFINLTLGECYQERGEAPRYERVLLHREDYKAGTLPAAARPLILSLGADVQKDRIEAEIVAWGKDKESWSVEYLTFPGATDDPNSEAWSGLYEAIEREHAGHRINIALIDSGYRTPLVYEFCQQFNGPVYPCMGDPGIIADRGTKRIIAVRKVPGHEVERVDMDTSFLKKEIYGFINRGTEKGELPTKPFPGFCHFPMDYDRRYAMMLTAESRVLRSIQGGRHDYVWVQHGHNEALDCRVYALASLYVMFYVRVDEIEREAREKQIKDPLDYTWAHFWIEIENRK